MAGLKRIFYIGGIIFTGLAAFCMVVSFSTSSWVQRSKSGSNDFVKIGLWEACFDGYIFPRDDFNKRYQGCWWIFSQNYETVREWLAPTWFVGVQVMISLSLLFQMLVVVFLLALLIRCCPSHVEATFLTLSSIVMFACGGLIAISLIVFGVKSEDRQWMPRPDQNYLSWSFGICVMSGFFSVFGAMCLVVASMRSIAEKSTAPSSEHAMKSRY